MILGGTAACADKEYGRLQAGAAEGSLVKGMTVCELAEELALDQKGAANYFRILGVETESENSPLSAEQVQLLREKIPDKMRAYKVAEEFGIHRDDVVKILRSLGFEIMNAMAALDREQVRLLRAVCHTGASAIPLPRDPAKTLPVLASPEPAPTSETPASTSALLGGADSLPLCLSEPNLGKQVVALGTLLEALLNDVLASRKVDAGDGSLLSLIDLGFDAPPEEAFQSVYRGSLHDARKVRNRKLHPQIGGQSPDEDEYRKARNIFLLGVTDLLPQLSSEVAQAVLFFQE